MRAVARRLGLIIGWLLTPVAAWAASLLGGWLGALAGTHSTGEYGGVIWLGAGSLVGAIAGALAWVFLMRAAARIATESETASEQEGDR